MEFRANIKKIGISDIGKDIAEMASILKERLLRREDGFFVFVGTKQSIEVNVDYANSLNVAGERFWYGDDIYFVNYTIIFNCYNATYKFYMADPDCGLKLSTSDQNYMIYNGKYRGFGRHDLVEHIDWEIIDLESTLCFSEFNISSCYIKSSFYEGNGKHNLSKCFEGYFGGETMWEDYIDKAIEYEEKLIENGSDLWGDYIDNMLLTRIFGRDRWEEQQ